MYAYAIRAESGTAGTRYGLVGNYDGFGTMREARQAATEHYHRLRDKGFAAITTSTGTTTWLGRLGGIMNGCVLTGNWDQD